MFRLVYLLENARFEGISPTREVCACASARRQPHPLPPTTQNTTIYPPSANGNKEDEVASFSLLCRSTAGSTASQSPARVRWLLHVRRTASRLLRAPGARLSLHASPRRSPHHYLTVRQLHPSPSSYIFVSFPRFLTDNEIVDLPSGAFSHLPALEELHLDNNQLSSLSHEYFDSLPNLRRLLV